MEVKEAIHRRRALRSLDVRPVEAEKIDALAEAARLSASCFNNQPWHFVFCTGSEALAAVRAALPKGNAWATRAPLVIAVSAKEDDDCQLSERRDYYLFDCGLAIGQLVLRATEMALVAHPIAGFDPAKVGAALGIPEGYVTITLIICGYHGPDDSLLSDKQKATEPVRPERRPASENFFSDRWGRPL